jgi:hypothetical protein
MIIRNDFAGDYNSELKDAQHRLYGWAVRWIVDQAWKYYRYAEEVRGTPEDEKLPGLEWLAKLNVSAFDHRVVQEAHDILAAGYRQMHKLGEKHWEERGDPKALEDGWDACVRLETQRWMADPFIVRAIVMATQFANKSEGLAAERALARYLREMYGLRSRDAETDELHDAEQHDDGDGDEGSEDGEDEEQEYTLEDLGEYEESQDEPEWESDEVDDEDECEEGEEEHDSAECEGEDEDGVEEETPAPSQSARRDALTFALGDANESDLIAAIDTGPEALAVLVREGYLSVAQEWDKGRLHPDSQDAAERSVLLDRRARLAKGFYERLSEARRCVVLAAAACLGIREEEEWVELLNMA